MNSPFVCRACRHALLESRTRSLHNGTLQRRRYTHANFAPKSTVDLKHIRQNPGLYEQNSLDRNYKSVARNGWEILALHEKLVALQKRTLTSRQRVNAIEDEVKVLPKTPNNARRDELLAEARRLKETLEESVHAEDKAKKEMDRLGLELPNLSSSETPVGEEPELLRYINGDTPPVSKSRKSHVEIGRELDLLDFEVSATTSGWGWYFLKNEAALLEQALIQYALSVAISRGWKVMTPPSIVYSHIASACGFKPRDHNGETQIYSLAQEPDASKPQLVLAGTAEIPFAGSQANKIMPKSQLPLKIIGASRSYRAEAGARGVDTKGLYRVHEFTKVEMFAWTCPPRTVSEDNRFDNDDDASTSQTERVFAEMLSIQTEILRNLNLHARVLEMPTADLGASAARKLDIEAFFPSRPNIDAGYGEVTSASICTDYQSRRLNTRVAFDGTGESGKKLGFAWTVNGTALAVPRVLACLLENGWDEESRTVVVPACLRRWMPGGIERISR